MKRLYLALSLLLILTGCAHRGSFTPPPDLLRHQTQLQQIIQWEMNGKLGIRTADDSGSATVKWTQDASDYRIHLSGPLGQKRMIITGAPNRVRLEQSDSPPLEARTPEALIREAAGWTLPVTQLIYWVRGVPAPKLSISHLQQNDAGLIAQLQQGGWTLTYSNYRNVAYPAPTTADPAATENFSLPGKIIAEHDEVRLILVIRDWQLGR